ncbi:MAG: 16S rRNA (uracil(1498)-N(3))-methyltransferase [Proteobacteria bacterium]|nr:16S rRNA (uracil(1498)-N(3))-methyltransferase [Pseudomonadota bacterium]
MKKIRLFVAKDNLDLGTTIKLCDNDFDYLIKVMRQKVGDRFFVFNGVDGEFVAQITAVEKKYLTAEIGEKISELKKVPNVTLAFAPIKNVRIDFIAEKATELGVARFQPILTQRTIVDKINLERFRANAKEACEQCERNDFPEIFPPKKLEKFLNEEETKEKILILCDESGQGLKASLILPTLRQAQRDQEKEIVILIGPEGGFSESEFAKMRQLKNLFSISLGPRILRADTAMISALTLVQEFL